MRYDLRLADVPRTCACGDDYSINHCLTCKRGGYVIIRHNAVRDTLAEVLREVCSDVKVEPQLIPVTGEVLPAGSNVTDNARSDVSAVGLWHPMNRAFIDVMVFNPHAPSNAATSLKQTYIRHERLESCKSRKGHLVLRCSVAVVERRLRRPSCSRQLRRKWP